MQILARKKTRKISFIQVVSEPHWGQNVFSEIHQPSLGSESVPEMEEEEGRRSGRPQGEREQGADAETQWYRR